MNIIVLDTNFKMVGILDVYRSFIWVDRYNNVGDFEITTDPSQHNLQLLQIDRYLYFEGSDHMMIIETLQLDSDAENGAVLTVTGRSLESILDRRIIWDAMEINGSVQDAIRTMITQAIISPSDTSRRISNFEFLVNDDTAITSLTTETKFRGESLLEAITAICQEKNIGYKLILSDNFIFQFYLYAGTDRSYDQSVNPYVVFSPKFDNLQNSTYVESKQNYKNATLVVGSEESRTTAVVTVGSPSGLSRREVFTDASGTSQESGTSSGTYSSQLEGKGRENLAEFKCTATFDGNTENTEMFQYRKDFNMGDVVELMNEYGIEGKVRMTEYIISDGPDGNDAYPTFIIVEE